jgi:hypothetical protein
MLRLGSVRSGPPLLVALALTVALAAPADAAVTFRWVFVNDPVTKEFFARPGARDALQQAADVLTKPLGDSLQARTISKPGKWILPFDPATGGGSAPLSRFVGGLLDPKGNLPIPADTILVVVGAHPFRADPFNHGGCLYSFSDVSRQNQKTVDKRGTTHGVPYVGVVSFANDPNLSFAKPKAGGSDFVASAEHELGHALGLINGTVDWDALTRSQGTQQRYFVGRNAVAAYKRMGGVVDDAHPGVPLDVRKPGHWAPSPGDLQAPGQAAVGLLQTRDGRPIRATMQEKVGSRFTELDFAALQDIGWRVSTTRAKSRPGTKAPPRGAKRPRR